MDLVVQSVAGVIYPVDVQSLVIQGIVAIHIGIGVMDNSIDEWSLVQSVEGSWDTFSDFTTTAIQAEIRSIAAGAFTSRSSPSVSVSGGARDSLQLSYIQVFHVFQICVMGVSFFPLNNYLLIQFELFLDPTRYRFPHRTYL